MIGKVLMTSVQLSYALSVLARCVQFLEDELGMTQIIQSGDMFFMWDEMNNDIYEFACQDLGEIYRALHHGELQKLDKWLLKEVDPLIH
jgi:hypothetical protein